MSWILWFGEGKYVLKAMELKMLHDPLNPIQQERYNLITGDKQQSTAQKHGRVQRGSVFRR